MCTGRPKKLRFFFPFHITLCCVMLVTTLKTFQVKHTTTSQWGKIWVVHLIFSVLLGGKKKTLSWWDQSRQRPLGAVGGASDLDFSFPSEHSINIKLGFSSRYIFFFSIVYLMHTLPFCGGTRTERLHPHVWAQKVHFPHKPLRTQQCVCARYCWHKSTAEALEEMTANYAKQSALLRGSHLPKKKSL